MSFVEKTRVKFVPVTTLTRPVTGGGVTQIELPKTGILIGILCPITIVVGGTVNTPNALGVATAIKRVVLRLNAGHVIFDMSGVSYFNLLAEMIQDNYNMDIYNNSRAAVSTGTKVLDIFIPVAENTRDEIGLLMLQNMQTFATLSIEWESEITVGGTTATITSGSCTPVLMLAEVPAEESDLPSLDVIHQILEEQAAISAAGAYDHQIAIGGTLVGEYYYLAAGWTQAQLRLQNSNIIADLTPAQHRMLFLLTTSRDVTLVGAVTGTDKRIFWDFAGTDGLGQFGSIRDYINTLALTSIFTRITAVGATTLFSLRRQLLNVN